MHFLLIDEYRPVKDSLLVGAEMNVEGGMDAIEGYEVKTSVRLGPLKSGCPKSPVRHDIGATLQTN
jgi:hypothetical protein